MARAKKPAALAALDGSASINPGRYKNGPLVTSGIGDCPDFLYDTDDCKARQAWRFFETHAPWLDSSHIGLVATACQMYGEVLAGVMLGVNKLQALRAMFITLGMTPTSAHTVVKPTEQTAEDKFFEDF